jgi:hypothetical protein
VKEKIVLIGAGSAMFTRGLVSDMIRRGQEIDLALVDTGPEALGVAEAISRKMVEAKQAPVKITASTDRRDVFPGATVYVKWRWDTPGSPVGLSASPVDSTIWDLLSVSMPGDATPSAPRGTG